MTKREERRLETRARLLRLARDMFLSRAYDDVPLNDLLAAAGLQKGGFYHHFPDKRTLFAAVYTEVNAELEATLSAAARAAGDGWASLLVAFDRYFDALEDAAFHRFFNRDGLAVLGWADWLAINRTHSLAVIDRLVAALAHAGQLRSGVPELVPVLLAGASDYAADWASDAGSEDERHARLAQARRAMRELIGLYKVSAAY